MTGFASPDVPAYVTYALVLVFGTIVAAHTVNRLLGSQPDRWAFAPTWLVFLVHAILPAALFWFLDYTGALNDTSIFAALLVAFGYRQIFAGGVQGITMAGQTPALWKPFEAWVNQIVDRISDRNRMYIERFSDAVQAHIAESPERFKDFKSLVLTHSNDAAAVGKALANLPSTGDDAADRRQQIGLMWMDLRQSRAKLYGWLLYQQHIVPWGRYWLWLSKGRAKLFTIAIVGTLVVIVAGSVIWLTRDDIGGTRQQIAWLQYHKWRFLKANATERDRWRSREYLMGELRAWGDSTLPPLPAVVAAVAQAHERESKAADRLRAAKAGTPEWMQAKADADVAAMALQSALQTERRALSAKTLLASLVRELRFEGLARARAVEIIGLLVHCHSPALNAAYVPELIEVLRMQNEVVRRDIRNVLLALNADYPNAKFPTELEKWEPRKEETPADLDRMVRHSHTWWSEVSRKRQ